MAVARASAGRGHVYVVSLDPTLGSEIKKTRP
jgi:mRNA-degrading endonuclease toxin of MazEF toxin-antitoxin module